MGPAVTASPRFPDPARSRKLEDKARPGPLEFTLEAQGAGWQLVLAFVCSVACLPTSRGRIQQAPSGDGGFSDSGDKDDDDDDDADEKMQSSGIPNGGHIRQESQEQSEVDHGDFEMVVSLAAGKEEEPRHTPPALARGLPQAPVATGH